MAVKEVSITLDQATLVRLDAIVQQRLFPTRNEIIQEAVLDKLAKIDRRRLAEESAKLEPLQEQAFADEGIAGDLAEWPEY